MTKIPKYKPWTAKSRPWSEIENHYIDLNNHNWGHQKLLELVRHIIHSDLSGKLFAYTSLDTLKISIYENIEPFREELHVSFNSDKQEWLFQYYAKPNEVSEFTRVYPADTGIEKFDNFIKMVKW
jgi:hypothetical protein